MNRFERLRKMNLEGFSEAIIAIETEMPYCYNKYCPYLSSDGFVCRSNDSKEHCRMATINYLSEEIEGTSKLSKVKRKIVFACILLAIMLFSIFAKVR